MFDFIFVINVWKISGLVIEICLILFEIELNFIYNIIIDN